MLKQVIFRRNTTTSDSFYNLPFTY